MIKATRYVAITTDETTTIDTRGYISIHCYIIEDWIRVPLSIHIQKLESNRASADNLLSLSMDALATKCGLEPTEIAVKLICIGADGISAFQGPITSVTIQIIKDFTPFLVGQHYKGHKLNLALKILLEMGIVASIEDLLKAIHTYFDNSLKKYVKI